MEYNVATLAKWCGCSQRTFERRIKKLKEKKLFKKTSFGKYYNDTDAELLAKLIGFKVQFISKK